jgi:uncharacterized protein (TIGR00730 family)
VIRSVTVYCASSRKTHLAYRDAARRLGGVLAARSLRVVYGGGAVGLMGALADGALATGGHVIGVIPRFMAELEWGHPGVEMRLVADMHERKRLMLDLADAAVALPGGCGTLEEVLEAMAWKRLGLWSGPIVLVSERGYYDPLEEQLQRSIREGFMDERHDALWTLVPRVEDVPSALEAAPAWDRDQARGFAVP